MTTSVMLVVIRKSMFVYIYIYVCVYVHIYICMSYSKRENEHYIFGYESNNSLFLSLLASQINNVASVY